MPRRRWTGVRERQRIFDHGATKRLTCVPCRCWSEELLASARRLSTHPLPVMPPIAAGASAKIDAASAKIDAVADAHRHKRGRAADENEAENFSIDGAARCRCVRTKRIGWTSADLLTWPVGVHAVAAPDGTAAGALSASAISDHAGNIWGQSEHFPGFNAEEAKNLMALFADPIERASEGIIVGGSRYVFLNGGDDAGVVRGKRGSTHGIVVKKTKTALVIGIHGDNLETRQVSAHVEQFGDYLTSQGM